MAIISAVLMVLAIIFVILDMHLDELTEIITKVTFAIGALVVLDVLYHVALVTIHK